MTEDGPGERARPARAPSVSVETRSTAASEAAQAAIRDLTEAGVPAALAAGDPRLWGPAAEPEASARLGGLRAHGGSRPPLAEIGLLPGRARARRPGPGGLA